MTGVQTCALPIYYRIADPGVARAIESLAPLLPPPSKVKLRSAASARLASARTCYDHLAGELGVRLTEALLARGVLVDLGFQYQMAADKVGELCAIGIEPRDHWKSPAGLIGRKCLDWTQRRHHLGGALGATLAKEFFRAGWIQRNRGERALLITSRGRSQLKRHFAVSF